MHVSQASHATAAQPKRIAPTASAAFAIASLQTDEYESDLPRVAIPRPEVQLIVRFGAAGRDGLDVHAIGIRQTAHRKVLPRGLRLLTARLQLGAAEAVLGVRASAIAGRIVPLEELWGEAATRRLVDQLGEAGDLRAAAAILERAVTERARLAGEGYARAQLARDAAGRLMAASVNAVADDLGVSERQLRRIFRETTGVSPKEFAKLARFHRALRAAREDAAASWAGIAAAAGYYDQAHLISEFRAIADATPRALLDELRAGAPRTA